MDTETRLNCTNCTKSFLAYSFHCVPSYLLLWRPLLNKHLLGQEGISMKCQSLEENPQPTREPDSAVAPLNLHLLRFRPGRMWLKRLARILTRNPPENQTLLRLQLRGRLLWNLWSLLQHIQKSRWSRRIQQCNMFFCGYRHRWNDSLYVFILCIQWIIVK